MIRYLLCIFWHFGHTDTDERALMLDGSPVIKCRCLRCGRKKVVLYRARLP